MKPLRSSLLRTCVLPLLLAALAARALLPAGFMAGDAGITFTVAMCSPDPLQTERVQPFGDASDGELPGRHAQSCEYCLAPLLGAAIDVPRIGISESFEHVVRVAAHSQVAARTLLRAQSPRGPPHA